MAMDTILNLQQLLSEARKEGAAQASFAYAGEENWTPGELGIRTRVEIGTPTSFISQQSGITDRYLVNLDNVKTGERAWTSLIEMLPIDGSKFQHKVASGITSVDVTDMPWVPFAWTKKGPQDSEMYGAMVAALDKYVDKMAEGARTESTSGGVTYAFDKTLWTKVLGDVEQAYKYIVVDERAKDISTLLFGVGLEEVSASGQQTGVYSNDIMFGDDLVEASIHLPEIGPTQRDRSSWKRFGAQYDIKLRWLLQWFMTDTFGQKPNLTELFRASMGIRCLSDSDVDNMISKMAVNMTPYWNATSVARMAVFERCLKILVAENLEWNKIGFKTNIELHTQTRDQTKRMEREESVPEYFGGSVAVKGSGSSNYGWLINGRKSDIDGSNFLRFALIAPTEDQEVPSGFNAMKKKKFTVRKDPDLDPFPLGSPTLTDGNIILAQEDRNADAYPFRSTVVGGLIEHQRVSYYDKRPSERIIHVPRLVNGVRSEFSCEGFVDMLLTGNVSCFSGEAAVPYKIKYLDADGIWGV